MLPQKTKVDLHNLRLASLALKCMHHFTAACTVSGTFTISCIASGDGMFTGPTLAVRSDTTRAVRCSQPVLSNRPYILTHPSNSTTARTKCACHVLVKVRQARCAKQKPKVLPNVCCGCNGAVLVNSALNVSMVEPCCLPMRLLRQGQLVGCTK